MLDTQMWIYFHMRNPRLPQEVADVIRREGDAIGLSAFSIWEALLLLQKGRLGASEDPEEFVREWLATTPLTILPITAEIAIRSRTLPFTHNNPADRLIAATADVHRAILATDDESLRALPWLRVLPDRVG